MERLSIILILSGVCLLGISVFLMVKAGGGFRSGKKKAMPVTRPFKKGKQPEAVRQGLQENPDTGPDGSEATELLKPAAKQETPDDGAESTELLKPDAGGNGFKVIQKVVVTHDEKKEKGDNG